MSNRVTPGEAGIALFALLISVAIVAGFVAWIGSAAVSQ